MNSELYQEVFAGARDGILVVEGRDGHVVAANPAVVQLLGYAGKTLVGKPMMALFPVHDQSAMNETLAEIWNNEGTDRMSCRLLKAEGDELTASISAHVVVQDGQAYLVIFVSEAVASPRKSSLSDEHRQLHVLIAEDNQVNQKVALGMMRKLGYIGVAADNGEHALELLRTGNFDVVFMDLQMPKMGGLEATVRIRAGEAKYSNREVPIVAMTGNASQQDRQDCLEAGMNGYLTKPVSSERILEAVTSLGSSAAEKDGRGAPFSMAGLIEQMNGDTELADEILEIFCEDTEDRIQRMAAAVTNCNFEAIEHEAQALEGGALNVRAQILVHLAREMCQAATNQEQKTVSGLIDEMVMELAAMLQGA